MCGIVGAVAARPVQDILVEGLRRLEYRGYDSAGVALHSGDEIVRCRRAGKVKMLEQALADNPLSGTTGIAHTRWATHGVPNEANAHPHLSTDRLAVVHNGIIENFEPLKAELQAEGFIFESETDTEVIAHLLSREVQQGLCLTDAVRKIVQQLDGAYALGVIYKDDPSQLVAARKGSPLVIGVGIGENFIASDQLALLQVTDRFIFLMEGDVARITTSEISIIDQQGQQVVREIALFEHHVHSVDKGEFKHFMLKEIYEQPNSVRACLEGRLTDEHLLEQCFGVKAEEVFARTKQVQIIACGTSFHAGLVAKYWIEELTGISCAVEVASEYRYRQTVISKNTLLITISQSGETADTLSALREAAPRAMASLAICNVPSSSLVRESDLCLTTNAGPEIGVASTKAFSTQLVALMLTTIALGRHNNLTAETEKTIVKALNQLPEQIENTLKLDRKIEHMAQPFAEKYHSLFLGRGTLYPVAKEGALKLKELSYIHAEPYPAGELKHGPLALVDKNMPIVAIAPQNEMLDKLNSNLQEVHARGGELFVFTCSTKLKSKEGTYILNMPECPIITQPILYSIPLQLFAYHVAILKGTDVDQPRNLAKSVTVE